MAFFQREETFEGGSLSETMDERKAQILVTLETMQSITLKQNTIQESDMALLARVECVTCIQCTFATPLTPFLTGRTKYLKLQGCSFPREETGASFATLDTLTIHHINDIKFTAPIPLRVLHLEAHIGPASIPLFQSVRETLSLVNGMDMSAEVFASLQISTLIVNRSFTMPNVYPPNLTSLHFTSSSPNVRAIVPNPRITHLTCSTYHFSISKIAQLFPNLEVLRLVYGGDVVKPLDTPIARLHTLHVYSGVHLSSITIPLKIYFHTHDVETDLLQ